MKIQVQPNKWSCLPTAMAMCINVPVAEVIKKIGHDGSTIIWPELPEPTCRQAFHIQEIADVADHYGYFIMQYDLVPLSYVGEGHKEFCPYQKPEDRFLEIVIQNNGILIGKTLEGKDHAVAWNGSMCHDPMGHRYALQYFNPVHFFRVEEAKYNKQKDVDPTNAMPWGERP